MNLCDLCQLSSPSGCTKLSNENCLKDALKLIRASVTSGDMIRALFPNTNIITQYDDALDNTLMVFTLNNQPMEVDLDWWNAPYKVGDSNGNG